MRRLIELLLGLDRGFLARDGDVSLSFDPHWPLGDLVGGFTWNVLLLALSGVLLWFVYLRDPAQRRRRLPMAILRGGVLALVVLLLNRPQLTVTQARIEPSVLAVMIDDSLSMRLADIAAAPNQPPSQRLAAVERLLTDADAKLLRDLAAVHQLRFYRFSGDAISLDAPARFATPEDAAAVRRKIDELKPIGVQTRLIESLGTVARELRGQRIAGALLLTDGRETDAKGGESASALRDLGLKVFAVPVGTDVGLRNVEIESVAVQDSVFAGDIVNVKVALRTTGVPPGTAIRLILKDKSGVPILDEGKPVELAVPIDRDGPQQAELQFIPSQVGPLDLSVEAVPLDGEIDDADNVRAVQLAVLDANLRVLYVDGYPRWEYRYLKQELIRDPTVNVSCLLTSADTSFAQEGDRPITRFPETIEELLEYDVVLFGDVDPRQFTDNQLALVNEFVSRRGGGFGMIAGPNYAPQKYQNTAIEPLLPVDISRVEGGTRRADGTVAEGFRIALTEDGRNSSVFRFFRDPKVNADYVAGRIQEMFWYCRGVTTKAGVGETLAQHPKETGPDGRPAPLVVVGRFGTGRTSFSALDDTWRWRYYTGEQIFNSYWTQTLRTLARGKKLGQRKLTLASERPVYQLGETARVNVRVLDPQVLATLPGELQAKLVDEQGQVVRDVTLIRRGASGDGYVGGFTADRLGRFSVKLPSLGAGVDDAAVPLEIAVPRLELNDPTVDRVTLARLAAETGGQVVPFAEAASLPTRIPSAQREIPLIANSPLWAAPSALALFAGLITAEWILRKRAGLV